MSGIGRTSGVAVIGMAEKSVDRRVARTRLALHRALNALTLAKGYGAITVEEICQEAKVGRSTFYEHYASKDELHRGGVENLRRLLVGLPSNASPGAADPWRSSLRFSLPLFEHVRDYQELLGAHAGSGGGSVALGTIRRIVSDLVRAEFAASGLRTPDRGMPREAAVQYIVGAYMAVLTWWLDDGARLPPERIDAMFRRLAIEGIERS
jgi:AcrR family transcriptional regulator